MLRRLLAGPEFLTLPGVYDALTAKIAAQAGFKCLVMGGYSIAASRLGQPDVGYLTMTEMTQALKGICDAVDLPVVADGDPGYGNALSVRRTVRGFEPAGAAMIQIEDQGFPKRCGHLDGKTVVPGAEMCGKLKAALDARRSAHTLILARTDALFIEALRTPEQMDAACQRFAHRIPLLANMVEGGKTPIQSAAELQQRGFRIVIFPGGTARAVAHTLQGYYASLHTHQTTHPSRTG